MFTPKVPEPKYAWMWEYLFFLQVGYFPWVHSLFLKETLIKNYK